MGNKTQFDPKIVFGKILKFNKDASTGIPERLVGLDEIREGLVFDLDLLFNPGKAKKWSKVHYRNEIKCLELMGDLVPLIIFDGDVGTGKSALAESIGEIVSKKFEYDVQMLKMSTQVRGRGFVGEMGTLLSESFRYAVNQMEKSGCPTLLIIDEADSILTSRAESGQHHEDKAGVNTILQHLDELKKENMPIAVIAITNRFEALDPAIKRRSTANYTFSRPTKEQRQSLFKLFFQDIGFDKKEIADLSSATNEKEVDGVKIPFSYADLTLKIILPALRDSVSRNKKISIEKTLQKAQNAIPSPRMYEK